MGFLSSSELCRRDVVLVRYCIDWTGLRRTVVHPRRGSSSVVDVLADHDADEGEAHVAAVSRVCGIPTANTAFAALLFQQKGITNYLSSALSYSKTPDVRW